MKRPLLIILVLLVAAALVWAVTNRNTSTGLANPASVYCEEQGGRVEIRTAEDGSQFGVCVFPDGSECEEWAFYEHGACDAP